MRSPLWTLPALVLAVATLAHVSAWPVLEEAHQRTARVGEDETLTIRCSSGQRINVVSAHCTAGPLRAPSSPAHVRTHCQGRPRCSMAASIGVFGDPCLGTFDYLEVGYTCEDWKQAATAENGLPYNPLGSPFFVAPRPTDKRAIGLMCSFVQDTPSLPDVELNDHNDTMPSWDSLYLDLSRDVAECTVAGNKQLTNVERTDDEDIKANWDRLYSDRSEVVADCCQKEGNEQELCVEILRQKTVDQYCFFRKNSPENLLGLNDPCCEEGGEARVQCMDQARYGFDVDIHESDRTIELMQVPVAHEVKQMLMMNKRPPAYDNKFCEWAKQQTYPDTTFAEATLQTMDPMQKMSEVTRKLISCCDSDDEATIDRCLTSVRQESIDDVCMKEKILKTAQSLIDPSVLTGAPAGLKALLEYSEHIPTHPCCQRSHTNRYSCFSQEWTGFKASRDPYDHTAEIAQYIEKISQLGYNVAEKLTGADLHTYWTGGEDHRPGDMMLSLTALADLDPISHDQLGWTPPAFCRGNDCPKFTILNKTENYEVRKYEATRWASTTVQNLHNLNGAMRTGFMRLFNYITGNNERGQKIAMTCPVRTKIVPGAGPYCEDTFTVSFMVPFAVETAPKPKDATVFLEEDPESIQYVSHFGGYASNDDWINCVHGLTKALGTVPFKKGHYYTAGYDSPFQIWNRHNECWLTQ